MILDKKFDGHTKANAYVRIYDDDNMVLFSYDVPVILLETNGWLQCSGLYSMTTRKHIGWFMKNYITLPDGSRGTYQLAKILCTSKHKMNIYTGEVLPI